jgi:hypothetical protein
MNCWEFKKCGREDGGAKAKKLEVYPACPNHGQYYARIAGRPCGGRVQGTSANKVLNCVQCDFYRSPSYVREFESLESVSNSQ